MERLTEKRDGQNVIPLRQNGKIKWAICSAGLGDAPTEYLYGDHADRLAAIEDILGDEYDLERLLELVEGDREGRHGRWKNGGNGLYDTCTACGEEIYLAIPMNYCPLCGARMDKEGDHEVS